MKRSLRVLGLAVVVALLNEVTQGAEAEVLPEGRGSENPEITTRISSQRREIHLSPVEQGEFFYAALEVLKSAVMTASGEIAEEQWNQVLRSGSFLHVKVEQPVEVPITFVRSRAPTRRIARINEILLPLPEEGLPEYVYALEGTEYLRFRKYSPRKLESIIAHEALGFSAEARSDFSYDRGIDSRKPLSPAADANSFGIYLMENPIDGRLAVYGEGEWRDVPLLEEPIISGENIYGYDSESHTIELPPSVIADLPRPPVSGLGFVVVANGERIYPGLFSTGISSFSFALPNICVTACAEELEGNALKIDRAYPTAEFAVGPDPRSDERIRTALVEAGKLKRPPAEKPPEPAGEAGEAPYTALEITTHDVIRFVQPGVGVALVRFENLGGSVVHYHVRFTTFYGKETEHRSAIRKRAEDGWQTPVLVQAGDISFEWSEGGPDKAFIYFDPRIQKATLVEAAE